MEKERCSVLSWRGVLLSLLLFTSILNAENIDQLLSEYNQNNDLSRQTIDENKGHLVLFTREKLERMHAKTLKDVMKYTPIIYYHESRYALPDPLTSGIFEPYRSNFIRIFIDGVEITQGWLGSGVVLYGDMNINFADHIEFYYMTPSFDTSVEPAYLTIFIYSKTPERDSGVSLDLMAGSRGYNVESFNYGKEHNNVSYMLNVSHTLEERERVDNGTDDPLKRDFERVQVFGYIKNEKHSFHLQIMQKNTDALAGLSFDATPLTSEIDYQNIHMDYQTKLNAYWKAQFSYDQLTTDTLMVDDESLLYVGSLFGNSYSGSSKNSTYSAELTYINQFGKHRVTGGVKERIKVLDSFKEDGVGEIPKVFDKEAIFSLFLQDQYALSQRELLSLGIEYSYIDRNKGVSSDDLLQLRIGYLYHGDKWRYKAYLYQSMFALDPFSYSLDLSCTKNVDTDYNRVQTTYGITQELRYKEKKHDLALMFYLLKDQDGLLVNSKDEDTKYLSTVLQYGYMFDLKNRMDIQLYYAHYSDIFELSSLDDYSGYISLMNAYGTFEFYNAVVWHQNSVDNKNYFDLTSSVSWNISEDLTFTIRGENILDKAKETNLYRMDPETGEMMVPLKVSPVDRRIVFELEYQL